MLTNLGYGELRRLRREIIQIRTLLKSAVGVPKNSKPAKLFV